MEENKESRSNQQEKQLPQWAKNIKISYDAYQQTHKNREDELGTFSRPGRINEKYQTQIRNRFYEFLRKITQDELPELILLRKGVNRTLSIGTNQGSSINLSTDPSIKYFIPGLNMIYRLHGIGGEPVEPKYIPESDNFVGIKALDPMHSPYGVHFDSLEPHQLPHGPLRVDEIDVILRSLEKSIQQESNNAMLQATKQEIQELQEQLTTEHSNREDTWAQQLKTRVLNLRDSVANYFRLPKSMGNFSLNVNTIKGKKDNREVYFLTEEGRLVLVPMVEKKTFFGKTKHVPDFTQAEEAPNKQWLRTGLLAMGLLGPIPRDIRKIIESS